MNERFLKNPKNILALILIGCGLSLIFGAAPSPLSPKSIFLSVDQVGAGALGVLLGAWILLQESKRG